MARNGDILLPAGLERVLDKSDKENPELNMQSHVEQVRKLLGKFEIHTYISYILLTKVRFS